ncbi:hypothetical protein ALC56_08317 [Trachymyrmex septentrionalis]|uniref:Uncharacterized protein n=1 Tax=Trachymyrmex septentrionalis TaxID=34720 RepID=A0A195F9H7_9HYME|nr:hypothetical protein ALC56_08317 [Trachymyrmex septentrionalis]
MPVIEELMRAACGRVVPHRGFARFPIALSRAHNSCAQLIETGELAADIFKNGRSDVAKDRPQRSLYEMHRTRPPCNALAISYPEKKRRDEMIMKESRISDRRIEHPDVDKKGQELRERSGFLPGSVEDDQKVLTWPTWFFRPDLPLGTPLPTSHVPNSSNVPTSSPLPSRTHLDVPKGPEPPSNSSKVHGQTPTICTVSDTNLTSGRIRNIGNLWQVENMVYVCG